VARPIDINEALREWVRQQIGAESRKAFAERTGLERSNLSTALKGKRNVTVEQVGLILAAQGRTRSAALLEIATIAFHIEAAAALPERAPPTRPPPRRKPSR
jgi:transcriptional regulator with XRE-family HTH domain